MILQYKLPPTPHFAASGLREMEERDVEQVTDLYKRYMDRFEMSPLMTAEEVRHNFLSGNGAGEIGPSGRREGQVLWVYVVEVISTSFCPLLPVNQVGFTLRRILRRGRSPISSRSLPSHLRSSATPSIPYWMLRTSTTTPPKPHSSHRPKRLVP